MEMNLAIVVAGSLCRLQLGSNQESRPGKVPVSLSRVNEDSVLNNQVSVCDAAPSLFGLKQESSSLTRLHGLVAFVIQI